MRIGLDLHGVIDASPDLFCMMTQMLARENEYHNQGHEVHVMTGQVWDDGIAHALADWGIYWTHFFSITQSLVDKGIELSFDDQGHPWTKDEDTWHWDRAKGLYAFEKKLDIVYDDSDKYHHFFKTPYSRYKSKNTVRESKMKI